MINLKHELDGVCQNNRDETFDDEAAGSEIGAATRFMSGWEMKSLDHDNDGNLDLLLGNGEPDDFINQLDPRVTYRKPLTWSPESECKPLKMSEGGESDPFAEPLYGLTPIPRIPNPSRRQFQQSQSVRPDPSKLGPTSENTS